MAAIVTYKKGVTVNTGNFESERFEFMVTRECDDNPESIGELTGALRRYVDSEIQKCVSELKGDKVTAQSARKKNDNLEDLMI